MLHHPPRRRLYLWLGLITVLMGAQASAGPAASSVLRFTIPRLADGRFDVEVILFHRDGAFHQGYALATERDRLPHSVDVTPSRPIQWQTKDGKPLDVPDAMRGYYSYKRPEFRSYKSRYEKGEIKIGYPTPTPPIAWDGKKLSGVVDVQIGTVDSANMPGRDSLDRCYRIVVEATGKPGGKLSGTFTYWSYAENDDDYGADNAKTKGDLVHAHWDADYWQPQKGTEYAKSKDWPQVRGPHGTGAAIECEQPFIDNLHDAKLLWISEEAIGGGRGAVLSRGGFAMYPYAWQNVGFGGFAGVCVADGKVFQYVTHADEDRVANDKSIHSNVYVELGADPRTLGNEKGHMRDTVLCLDARTGRTLWWFKSKRTFGNVPSGKGGKGTTVVYHDGRVFARGSGGLYCLDADSGKLIWNQGGDKQGDMKAGYGITGSWSRDMSPIIVDGVIVMSGSTDDELIGIDPADGKLLWQLHGVNGGNAIPGRIELDGKPHLIVAAGETGKLSLVQPRDGKVVWSTTFGPNQASLAVWNDIICGAGEGKLEGGWKGKPRAAATGMRIAKSGATRLWQSEKAGYPPHRSVPVAHDGFFYIDDRINFFGIDAKSGRIVKTHPHIYHMTGGSHNWVWTIAGNNRIITSGVIMFNTADKGFDRLPGRLSVEMAGGYMCPIKPALADGRLIMRLGDKIACYDLRRDPRQTSKTLALTAHDAYASSLAKGNPVEIDVRFVNGKPQRVYASTPDLVGPEGDQVNKWIRYHKRPLDGKSYPATGLELKGDDNQWLIGTVRLPMGWHYEPWKINGRLQGESFIGAYERIVPPLDKPIAVKGKVTGRSVTTEQGRLTILTLEGAATQGKRTNDPRAVTIALLKSGKAERAWAMADSVNGNAHEVDDAGLNRADNSITGKLVVIFRDDPYFHLNASRATSVAGTYQLDVKWIDGDYLGTYTGTFGSGYQRTGKLTGKLKP